MKVLTSGGIVIDSACGRMILAGLLPVAQAKAVGRLVLPLRDRLQTAADDFRQIGRREQDQADLGAQQLVDGDAGRQEQREHDRCHEQHRDQRHAADQLDIGHAQRLDDRQVGPPAQRQQDRQRKGHDKTDHRQDQGQRQAAPQAVGDERQAQARRPTSGSPPRRRRPPRHPAARAARSSGYSSTPASR